MVRRRGSFDPISDDEGATCWKYRVQVKVPIRYIQFKVRWKNITILCMAKKRLYAKVIERKFAQNQFGKVSRAKQV